MEQGNNNKPSTQRKTKSPQQNQEAEQKARRLYQQEQELDHDLHILEEAKVAKDHGYNPDKPVIVHHPHKHIYHSIDSNGVAQEYCTPALGHTHKVIEKGIDENGYPYVKFGPPIVRLKKKGKTQDFGYRYEGDGKRFEAHEHEVTYKFSEKIKPRRFNADLAKFVNEREKREQKIAQSPTA